MRKNKPKGGRQNYISGKKEDWILLIAKIYFYKNKFANTYISYEKFAIAFHINTLKLF